MGLRVPGLKTVATAGRWLRSRLGNRALILLYHRVGRSNADPFHLAVAPERFARQMETLRRCVDVMPLQTLVTKLRQGHVPHGAVAVTFDDGYADNLHAARPALEAFDVPATIFMVSGAQGRAFWWDELSGIIFSSGTLPGCLRVQVDRLDRSWTLRRGARKGASGTASQEARGVFASIYHALQALGDEQRREALKQLAECVGGAPLDPGHRALSRDELLRLADLGLFSVGAHTVTHPVLSRLTKSGQRSEIVESKSYLEGILGHPIESFAYPNGAASASTRELVAEAGFTCACGTAEGTVGTTADPFDLPRLWVRDWNGPEFERRVARWLHD